MERKEIEHESRGAEITKPDSTIGGITGGARNKVNKIVDLIRTDPIGYGVILWGIQIGAEYTQGAQDGDNIFKLAAGISISVLEILVGSYHLSMQFALKRKLEKMCAANGYSDVIFTKTIKAWCDRQTARVVARRLGKLDEYTALCDKNKKRQQFSWLWHF